MPTENTGVAKIKIGHTMPFVAVYNESEGAITYTGCVPLSEGVSVKTSMQEADNNDFYANNMLSETDSTVTGGDFEMEVKGLVQSTARLIYGIPEPTPETINGKEMNLSRYGDKANPPYCGYGEVTTLLEHGVTTYRPTILPKIKFTPGDFEVVTKKEKTEYQTETLKGKIYRDDSANHDWKVVGEDVATLEEAVAIIKAYLGVPAV